MVEPVTNRPAGEEAPAFHHRIDRGRLRHPRRHREGWSAGQDPGRIRRHLFPLPGIRRFSPRGAK